MSIPKGLLTAKTYAMSKPLITDFIDGVDKFRGKKAQMEARGAVFLPESTKFSYEKMHEHIAIIREKIK